jgi:hypothetical protein
MKETETERIREENEIAVCCVYKPLEQCAVLQQHTYLAGATAAAARVGAVSKCAATDCFLVLLLQE